MNEKRKLFKRTLTEIVRQLCKNEFYTEEKFSINGVIGVVLSEGENFLIHINEDILKDEKRAEPYFCDVLDEFVESDNTAKEVEEVEATSEKTVTGPTKVSEENLEIVVISPEEVAFDKEESTNHSDEENKLDLATLTMTSFPLQQNDMNTNQWEKERLTTVSMHSHLSKRGIKKGSKKSFSCGICKTCFKYRTSLNLHKKIEHSSGKLTFSCEFCNASFSEPGTLNKHKLTIHSTTKPYACEFCKASFKQRGNMIRHVRTVHSSYKPFSCQYCDASFKLKAPLERHQKSKHSIKHSSPYTCSHCGDSFKRDSSLQSHLVNCSAK
ncbi:DgyrCDS13510 [Dimorphilus gyrociliatus]|uniref:DgyrCDS13510 n=1 Tax=Dimorphilus gyrociliatus TaxID=2664684 RepID=A0A7I8WAU6_9ANNE|nr:DgyrCDS13510 [Dimorphilus gyrociliatus]